MSIKHKAAAAASITGLLTLAACGGTSEAGSGDGAGGEINLIGYSVLEQANSAVIEGFQGTDAGSGEDEVGGGVSARSPRAIRRELAK